MTRRNVQKQGRVFPLFSPDSDDWSSLNFCRIFILYRSCDTRIVGLGQYCSPKVYNGFKAALWKRVQNCTYLSALIKLILNWVNFIYKEVIGNCIYLFTNTIRYLTISSWKVPHIQYLNHRNWRSGISLGLPVPKSWYKTLLSWHYRDACGDAQCPLQLGIVLVKSTQWMQVSWGKD